MTNYTNDQLVEIIKLKNKKINNLRRGIKELQKAHRLQKTISERAYRSIDWYKEQYSNASHREQIATRLVADLKAGRVQSEDPRKLLTKLYEDFFRRPVRLKPPEP